MADGSVTLSAAVQEETRTHFFLLVCVEDTGIGISKEDQTKLFGMFSKIKDARVCAAASTLFECVVAAPGTGRVGVLGRDGGVPGRGRGHHQ